MLSNTAETKPRPNAVCQLADGSLSTGIIEAAVTSARRKIVPLNVLGNTSQSGRRNGTAARITAQTARPITGTTSSNAGNLTLATILATIAAIRIVPTM